MSSTKKLKLDIDEATRQDQPDDSLQEVVVRAPPKKHVTRHMMMEKLSKCHGTIEGILHPWGVTINKKGEIIVAEFNAHRVSVFSPKGKRLQSFGAKGSQPGQFNCPCGVAVDVEDNILVTDYNNHRVQKFTRDGTFMKAVGQQGDKRNNFDCPIGVAVHPFSGNIYIVDNKNHRVQVLTSDFMLFSRRFGNCGNDDGQFFHPWDVAFDSTGKVYVADSGNHRIQVFKTGGKFLKKFGREGTGDGELRWPSSITIDYDNVVYVTEDGNNRFSTFTTEGRYLTSVGSRGLCRREGEFNSPRGVAVGQTGAVFLSDSNHNRLQLY